MERVLSSYQRQQVDRWLSETGELWVDLYVAHSGGSSDHYFIRSAEQLENLISKQTGHDLQICVFRRLQFPLRSVADASLLAEALKQIPDGQWYHIFSLEHYYPDKCDLFACGDTHDELRRDFAKVTGKRVAIGQNPFDGDDKWVFNTPDEVLVLNLKRSEAGVYVPE